MRLSKSIFSIALCVLLMLGVTCTVSAEENVTIRAAWWGGTARNDMMNEIYDLYESEHPNVTIEREYGSWEDYWIRYSTQVAGGNAPDLIQFTDRELASYVGMGAVEPLAQYIDAGTIDVSQFSQSALSAGTLDGVIYEIAMGLSTPIIQYNATAIEAAGMPLPEMEMTWEELKDYLIDLKNTGKLPDGMYAIYDECGVNGAFHWFYSYMRQKGEDWWTSDGKLGFTQATVEEWLGWWDELRNQGVVLPYDRVAEFIGKPKEENPLVMGAVSMHSVAGNQAKIYQNNMEDETGIIRLPSLPGGVNEHGEVIAGAYLAISSTSQHKEVVADIINFFVNDERVNKIFNCEQGIYGNVAMQQAVADQIDPLDLVVTDVLNITLESIPMPSPYPSGSETVITLLQDANEFVAYDVMSIEDAAKQFMSDVENVFLNAA